MVVTSKMTPSNFTFQKIRKHHLIQNRISLLWNLTKNILLLYCAVSFFQNFQNELFPIVSFNLSCLVFSRNVGFSAYFHLLSYPNLKSKYKQIKTSFLSDSQSKVMLLFFHKILTSAKQRNTNVGRLESVRIFKDRTSAFVIPVSRDQNVYRVSGVGSISLQYS